MKIPTTLLFLICFIQIIAQEFGEYLIADVNIVSVEDGHIIPHQNVFIKNGIIERIETANAKVHTDINIFPAMDKYLMPGLAEMHAHIPTPEGGDDTRVKETLFLYLANGITTIRGMLGDPYHLDLKKEVLKGGLPSPTIYTSSPSLNGNTVPNKETARRLVTQYAEDGYDFLKIHPGIQREVFDELVVTARQVGITFSGHVPMDVGIEHAIASRYATIDHLDGFIEGLVAVEQRPKGGFFGVLIADQCDANLIDNLVKSTLASGISVVPTQTLMTRWLSPTPPEEMVQEPEMAYIPASMRFNWRQNKQQMLDRLDYRKETYDRFIDLRHKFLRAFQKAGVPILLGSDAPQVFNVPGFSIHHEMQSMSDAGLTHLEIIQSGTINIARFFGREQLEGTIAPGKVANLLILDENPLEDIAAMQKIQTVIYRGNMLGKSKIDTELSAIAKRHQSN